MVAFPYEGASRLLANLSTKLENRGTFGSMSTNIYDTAWVSMVAKPLDDGQRTWLFPQSFDLVLSAQSMDGGWPGWSELDKILCTMAALISILRHNEHPDIQGCANPPKDYMLRISRAVVWLEGHLHAFDIG